MSKIAHVPQSIYLSDSTIAENIDFVLPLKEINHDRIKYVSQIAEADKFISSLDLGFQTQIGERGVKLSGGQRQRIGLARALYKNSEIIVLDEATSALDNDTEARVMANLIKLDKELTLIIIAHRLSTLSGCDLIIKINSGRLEKMGTYQEVIGQN
jgi:ATP-binding cassette subfamily B protein